MSSPTNAAELELTVKPLSPEAFAAYGHVLQASGQARAINSGTTLRFDWPPPVLTQAGGTPALALFRARAQAAAGPWHELERHRLGSQSFVPLRGAPCIIIVALGQQAPDARTLAAFLADGQDGWTLHPGVWHHPLIALEDGDFLVIERAASQPDCELVRLEKPLRLSL